MTFIPNGQSRLSAKFYHYLRLILHKKRGVLRVAQIIRSLVILGPFRNFIIRYYQMFSRTIPIQTDSRALFPHLDVNAVAENLHGSGFSLGSPLPQSELTEILYFWENNKRVRNWNPHKECEIIDKLSRNERLVHIVRQYLGAEPILWLTELRWTGGVNEKESVPNSLYQEPNLYDVNSFHYDTLDCKSLSVFIYLTDVDLSAGPHVMIMGTHKTKTFCELANLVLDDSMAYEKYADKVNVIVGSKGTVFFEETCAYHKAASCDTHRLMLKFDYVIGRKPPPDRAQANIRFAS